MTSGPIKPPRGHRTRAELAARQEKLQPGFEAGVPPMPGGLPRAMQRRWHTALERFVVAKVPLAKSDGPAILEWLRLKQAGDPTSLARAAQIATSITRRPPFPEPTTEPEPSPAVLPVAPDCARVAEQYAQDVLSGRIVAGKYVRLACQRFVDDLEHGGIRGLNFDTRAAQHVVDYLSRLDLGALLPWQCFVLANLFGFKRADGLRRFRNAFVMIAKKNGKSSLSAGLSLYMTDPEGDGEPRAFCACAATTRYQSQSICFKEALRLRASNTDLSSRSKAFKGAMTFGDSSFEPLAANSDKLNGLNIHAGVLDELGDHATSDLYTVFSSSTVQRKQPMLLAITTAGASREQIAFYQRQHAAQVLEGVIQDDRFFAYIAEMDEGDDWKDERNWIKANPSLDVLVPIQNLRDAFTDASQIISAKRDFMRYHLNQWPSTSSSGWIDIEDLSKVGNLCISQDEKLLSVETRIANAETRLAKRPCLAGLDLAMVDDLSVLALIFPPLTEGGIFEALFRIWCPEENLGRRSREQRVPYEEWAEKGFIIPTPGETTDFKFVREEILRLGDTFRITELGFDIHMAHDLVADLQLKGLSVTQIEQGYKLDPAIRRVEKLVKERKFCMHGHPVAHWCFSNVALDHGVRECRLDKKKAREKIDAAAAAIFAIDVFMKTPPVPPNPYVQRGLLLI